MRNEKLRGSVKLFRCAGKGLVFAVFDDGDFGVCGVVGAHDLLYAVADGFFAVGVGGFHESVQVFQELVVVEGYGAADVDELVVGLGEAFLGHEFFLIELLAGAEAGIDDLDIHIRLEAGEADHVAGQGVDLHRRPHVEDEDLTPVGIGPGQHHKAHRLGDGHEVADDIRVGDRDGAAFLNLPLEDGDHGAVGAQDVAEADGHELGFHIAEDLAAAVAVGVLFTDVGEELREISGAALLDLGVEGLDDHLAEALGSAHDVRGVHGLVRGDQDKALTAMDHGGIGRLISSDGVVLNRLTGAVLHEGDVLVGRGMIDDLGMILLKNLEDTPAIADRADEDHEVQVRILLAQFQLDGIGVVFVDIEDNELLGIMPRNLTAELRADAPSPAGDEDDLAVDEVENLAQIRGDGLAPQKVLDGDVLEFRNGNLTRHQLIHPRQDFQLRTGLVADAEDLFSVFAGHTGHGEDNLGDMVLLGVLQDRFPPADNGNPLNGAVPFVLVVVDDADRTVTELVTGLHIANDHAARFPGTDDHDTGTCLAIAPEPGPQEEQKAEEKA